MPVTNGTVEYSRMVRPADFEHQTFKVSYSFVVNEGEDHAAVTAEIADEAVAIVHGRLGLAAKAPAKAPVQETQEPKGKARSRRGSAPETVEAQEQPPAAATSPSVMDDEPAAPAEITDKQLTDALTKAKAKGANKDQLKEAITSFAPRMTEIPQDRRAAFIGVLDSLPS
jgi:hypothetical protein